jgi:hypothetical protein
MAVERPIITCMSCDLLTCRGYASNPESRRIEDKDGEVIGVISTGIALCDVLHEVITEAYFLWLINWDRSEVIPESVSDKKTKTDI